MKKQLIALFAAALLVAPSFSALASPASLSACQALKLTIGDNIVKALCIQAAEVWNVTATSLWLDYTNGILNIEFVEGTTYELFHADHGSVLLTLEDGSF